MKNNKIKIFLYAVLIINGSILHGSSAIKNSSLNTASGQRPEGWALWTWSPVKEKPTLSDARYLLNSGQDNSPCVQLESQKFNHVAVISSNYQTINVKKGEHWHLQCMIRSLKEQDSSQIKLSISFLQKGIPNIHKAISLLPTQNWQKISMGVQIPSKASSLRIEVTLQKPGKLLVDDISFKKISDFPPTPDDKNPASIRIGHTPTAPQIDGLGNESAWLNAVQFGSFQMPRGNGMPQAQTRVKMLYDLKNLYLLIDNYDENLRYTENRLDSFRCKEKTHDGAVWFDDCNEIMILPRQKGPSFRLIINCHGVVYDQKNNLNPNQWTSNTSAAGKINNGRWTLELAIPFQNLEITPEVSPKPIYMNVCRTRWTSGIAEHSSWIPAGKKGFNDPQIYGKIILAQSSPLKTTELLSEPSGLTLNHHILTEKNIPGHIDYEIFLSDNSQGIISEKIDGTGIQKISLHQNKNDTILKYRLHYSIYCSGILQYRSPKLIFRATESIGDAGSRLVRTEYGGTIEYIKPDAFYIMGGTTERITLLLYSSLSPKPSEIFWTMELPEYCSLVSSPGNSRYPSPLRIQKQTINRNNQIKNKYTLFFNRNFINSPEDPKWNLIPIPLFLEGKNPHDYPLKSEILYQAGTANKNFTEKKKILPLCVLPEIRNQRADQKFTFMVWNWYPFQNITQHPWDIQQRIFRKYQQVGLNTISTELSLNTTEYRRILRQKYGLRCAKMLPTLTGAANFPFADTYTRNNPQDCELSRTGKKLPMATIAPLLSGTSKFLPRVHQVLEDMARTYDILHMDYEFGICNPTSPGYSPLNILSFCKHQKISNCTTKQLLDQYKPQWVQFRTAQNGRIMSLYRQAIKSANPSCLLSAYSAYQRDREKWEIYGVDWSTMAPDCDFIMCGYGRGNYRKTREVIPRGMQICGGVGMFGTDKNLNQSITDIFRRITDTNSFMIFTSDNIDGRTWYGAARAISIVNRYPEFFRNNKRADDLVSPEQNDIAILTSGNKRLIFLFNENNQTKVIRFKNLKLPPNSIGWNLETGEKIITENLQSYELPPWDVRILLIGTAPDWRPRLSPPPYAGETVKFIAPINRTIEQSGIWQPVDWSSFPYSSDNIGYDLQTKFSGDYSLYIRHTGFGSPYWTTFRFLSTGEKLQEISPGEKTVFHCRLKTTENMNGNITIKFRNKHNQQTGLTGKTFSSPQKWTLCKLQATAPAGSRYVSLGLAGRGTGIVWFEPVSLKKNISSPPEK